MPSQATPHEDDFQKELVELFGQEAREWLVQIDASLTELESHPPTDRHAQLVDAIVRAITSLGGSAATINLPDVERTTFALLPFIEAARDRTTVCAADYARIREQYRLVAASVCDATGLSLAAGLTAESESSDPPRLLDVQTAIQTLRTFQESVTEMRSGEGHFASTVIQRLELEAKQGVRHIEPDRFERMLADVIDADEAFLQNLRQTIPDITRAVQEVKRPGVWAETGEHPLSTALVAVQQLQGQAKHIHALPLMLFLGGLQSFLTLVSGRRLSIAPRTLDAVAEKIAATVAAAQGWVEIGRKEREAIAALIRGTCSA